MTHSREGTVNGDGHKVQVFEVKLFGSSQTQQTANACPIFSSSDLTLYTQWPQKFQPTSWVLDETNWGFLVENIPVISQ